MQVTKIKVNNINSNYSIIIGKDVLKQIPGRIKILCPLAKKIILIVDNKIPKKYKDKLKNILNKYEIYIFEYSVSEKFKSFENVNRLVEKCLFYNLNRSDILISFGGGIIGDLGAFAASIIKRGINFINIPTTLLAQVDSAIGGKTGVNSHQGKNLIGSFYQPRLVLSDTSFLNSLPKKEMVCGYAEILKHAIIKDKKFYNWLKLNTKFIFSHNSEKLIYAIKKSNQIKLFFVNKDVNEKNLRMLLNFGHTFAHAIEIKNNYSKNTTHGEAVLTGIMLATKLSVAKKICSNKTFEDLERIYKANNLNYTIKDLVAY